MTRSVSEYASNPASTLTDSPRSSSRIHQNAGSFGAFVSSHRACVLTIVLLLFLSLGVSLLLFLLFFAIHSSTDATFWTATLHLPLEAFTLLHHNPTLILLEPYHLARVHALTESSCWYGRGKICHFDKLNQLRWKFQLKARFNVNRGHLVTVGAAQDALQEQAFASFTEINRTSCLNNLLSVLYEQPTDGYFLKLVILYQDEDLIPESCKNQLPEEVPAANHLPVITHRGIRLPGSIPVYFSRLPSLAYPPIPKRVATVDARLRALSRQSGHQHAADLIHPNASQADVDSHNPSVHDVTMITPTQIVDSLGLLINPKRPCGGPQSLGRSLLLLVLIFNRPSDAERRRTIRETYGSTLVALSAEIEFYFLIARPGNAQIQHQIESESRLYGDLIQVDYLDSYYGLTLKSISMLRWTALHCPRARFLLKLDDDSYLRPRPFLEWLKTVPANRFYGTHVLQPGSRPVQREDSRWALSRRYYPPSTYPAYQNGVYLLPANLSVHLYEAIVQEEVPGLTLPALPFEDVYINGVLGKVVRLAHAQVDNIRQTRGVHIVEVDRLQGVHLLFDYLNSSDIRHYWKVWQ